MTIPRMMIAALPFILAAHLAAKEPQELHAARQQFAALGPHPSEEARAAYLTRLIRIRERFAQREAMADWQAIDAELRRYPAPKDSAKELGSMLIGEWQSPRHEYLYRKDGVWLWLRSEWHGRWSIEGNQLRETAVFGKEPAETRKWTIILIGKKDFVFTDGRSVFYETRISK
jgi:hypothetical protein